MLAKLATPVTDRAPVALGRARRPPARRCGWSATGAPTTRGCTTRPAQRCSRWTPSPAAPGQSVIGQGGRAGFARLLAGPDGRLFAIRANGDVLRYQWTGNRWSDDSRKVTATGLVGLGQPGDPPQDDRRRTRRLLLHRPRRRPIGNGGWQQFTDVVAQSDACVLPR
ncbi:hypothetical protein [Saccharothrix australiensis]|uniref:hypothetical protein n=1 Tax=Saccharothrix australiensis TaxID=2072 RepID=UPI0011C4A1E2|nr:hypothetical protein [Saccharothrix australiensis]